MLVTPIGQRSFDGRLKHFYVPINRCPTASQVKAAYQISAQDRYKSLVHLLYVG
jgi:hypothetical protein